MQNITGKIYPKKITGVMLSWLNGYFDENEIRSLSVSDWALIDEVAKRKAIMSFLFYKFKEKEFLEFLPENIRDSWQGQFYNNLKRNETILLGLSKAVRQLKNSGVSVILLKGSSLLVDTYPNSGLRPMGDADILIKKNDMPQIVQIFQEISLELCRHDPASSTGEFDIDLMFSGDKICVEVFPNLYQYERFKGVLWSSNGIWENSRLVNFEGEPARVLSFQDQLLHLCQHICIEHLLSNIMHFLDIREFIKQHENSLNWSKLLGEAKRQNLCKCLYYALFLAKKFFDANIPDWVIEELKPAWIERIALSLLIKEDNIFKYGNIRGANKYVLQSLMMDKISGSFKVVLKGFFPSREWFLYRYGNNVFKKIYLYRIIHPFKILFG